VYKKAVIEIIFAMSRKFFIYLMLFTAVYAQSASHAGECVSDRFIEYTLPHITQTRGTVRFYESNGSGVGINDLNNDGLLDIFLGNLNGANTILWNEGNFQFLAEEFTRTRRTRAVNLVDVDGDGWIDIVLTTQIAAPVWWRNNGDETFSYHALNGVDQYAYTMQWADADADGDLDLVTASYDAELFQLLRDTFLFSGGAGVFYYENQEDVYQPTRLANESQALAIWLSDLNGDGNLDLFIGNDFRVPDQSWSFDQGVWMPNALFDVTAYSTMSFDVGDVNNDGAPEFFAADMQPLDDDPHTQEAWQPILDDLARVSLPPGDLQISENILLFNENRTFVNQAHGYGAAATGWSWSSKFGDLDNDGFLDLYIVNGMMSVELFGQLPNDELVEPNQALRNLQGEGFVPAPEWGLGTLTSGRGMSMADLDNDGDLDIVVNNLNAPAQLFENNLCGGSNLQVELRDPTSQNRFGIGARLSLHTTTGTYYRDMRAASGYLSGDPARVHFGLPEASQPLRLEVEWADGGFTTIDSFGADFEPIFTVNR
jgi:hypothetical protein